MKFKELLESQQDRFDLYNAIAGRIKLDKYAEDKLLPKEDKSKRFRHSTNLEGALFLTKNKDKDLQISASEIKRVCDGIETDGSAIVSLTGRPVIWFPTDAFTFTGEGGIRWMDWSQFDHRNQLLDEKYKLEYYEKVNSFVKKYPELANMFSTHYTGSMMHMFYGTQFSKQGRAIAPRIREWEKNNPKEAKALLSMIMRYQKKWLNTISKKLKPLITSEYKRLKNNPNKFIGQEGFSSYDEAVVDNVVVRNLYIKEAFTYMTFLTAVKRDYLLSDISPNAFKDAMKQENEFGIYNSFKKLTEGLTKDIPFTFLDVNCSGRIWKERVMDQLDDKPVYKPDEKNMGKEGWERSIIDYNEYLDSDKIPREIYNQFLDYFGIKEHKRTGGLQWYVKK